MKSTQARQFKIGALAVAAGLLAAAPAQAQFQERTLRLSASVPKEHPQGNGVAKVTSCAAQKSGGKMKIQSFWDATLGNDVAAISSLRGGTLDMVIVSTAPLAGIVPAIGAFDLPFLFNDAKEADQLLDGKVGDWFAAKLPPVGLVNLSWWENGFRHATNSKRSIVKAEDFDGVKMRVMQNNVFIDTFKSLGTNPVPMAFSEVYMALETKAVDGQENPFANIENMKFYEVQKYLTLTRHAYSPLSLLMSKKAWDSMSPPEQAALRECAAQGRDEERRVNREAEARSVANLRAKGMIVNEISPQEMLRIRERTKVVYEQHRKSIGDEAMNMVLGEIKRIRGN